MQRIAIIGSPGSGKSTFAHHLGQVLSITVTHLDAMFWESNWQDIPKAIWSKDLEKLLDQECWILDGNHPDAIDHCLNVADTIIFLDLHQSICVSRVVRRFLRYRGKSRPDLPGHIEVFDWDMVKGVWFYPKVERPNVLEKLEQYGVGKQTYRLQSLAEINRFLQQIRGCSHPQ